MHTLIKHMACALLLVSAANVNAALVNFTVDGVVDAATNYGGLSAGDAITADVTLDLAGYTGSGIEQFFFTGSNTLNITAGTLSFDQSMDTAASASISFNNGTLFDLDFTALLGVNGAPEDMDSLFLNVLANRSVTTGNGANAVTTNYQLAAHWNATTLAPVPVPAAVWLLGSGLVGLAGFARRSRS